MTMRTLYQGLRGDDVRAWKNFLVGIDPSSDIVVDDEFDSSTTLATKKFQVNVGIKSDGVAGRLTLAKAMLIGFDPSIDDRDSEESDNWPPQPDSIVQMTPQERMSNFGQFAYVPSPNKGNAEAITITDGWVLSNIDSVNVPQLSGVAGAPKTCNVLIHTKVAPQLQSVFAAWESAGLLSNVLTWGGSWVPRFIRGSRTTLSNHAWGTAFDINVQWNMLGSQPALKGNKGSVRELVDIAVQHGWFWGGWFKGRRDGMHFEAYKIVT